LTEVTTQLSTGATVEVMVVDDHPGFRTAVRTTLALDGRCRTTAEASSMAEAMSLLGQMDHLPDLVLLDVNLGEIDGMRGAAMIVDRYPTLPVLLCSTAPLHELPPMPDHAGVSFAPKELLDVDIILDAVDRARGH
jgi:DNA-binding NarL/FixJ family response regulator